MPLVSKKSITFAAVTKGCLAKSRALRLYPITNLLRIMPTKGLFLIRRMGCLSFVDTSYLFIKKRIKRMIPIQFITHYTETLSYEAGARAALEGGCRWIQLRMKEASRQEVKDVAIKLRKWCDQYEAVLLLDDRVDLVKEVAADGVHLGKMDMPVAEARKILGEEYIIGGTANTIDDCVKLAQAQVDYIGCGPFRFTKTKQNLSPRLGVEGYQTIIRDLRAQGFTIPLVAIGGIELEDVNDLMRSGVNGIAVSGCLLRALNPVEMMRQLIGSTER